MKTEAQILHDRILAAMRDPDDQPLRVVLSEQRGPDIAEVFEMFDDEERSRLFLTMPSRTAAEVFVLLHEDVRGDVVEDLDTARVTAIVSELPLDDAADVVGELSDAQTDELLRDIEEPRSQKLSELLTYDKDSAGGIMDPELVSVRASQTVRDAVQHVRQAAETSAEYDFFEVFVVDDDERLVGIIPLHRLVTSAKNVVLSSIADPDLVSVNVDEDQEEVLKVMRKYDLAVIPVVDPVGTLVGHITSDDILDVAEEEAAEDLYRMAGTEAAERETSSSFDTAFIRLRWLITGILVTLGSAVVVLMAEPKFDQRLYPALIAFVPMIAALGGNCGIQISTVIIRGFALGDLAATKAWLAVEREWRVVLILAVACAAASFILVNLFLPLLQIVRSEPLAGVDTLTVASSVALGIMFGVLVSACIGLALPFVFRRVGVDPAIASGPLVTSLNDLASVTVYLTVASLIAT